MNGVKNRYPFCIFFFQRKQLDKRDAKGYIDVLVR